MEYAYAYPKNPIPRLFLTKRHVYVRSILKNSKVLDLGCNHYKVISNAIGLDTNPKTKPDIVGSCLSIPFPNEFFDSVTALELIEHFRSKEQSLLLQEVYRVLKKHGQFIVSTPNISEATRKLHDALWFVSHSLYAPEDLGKHIGELTHPQLKTLLNRHGFMIRNEKAFSFVNYVVECEKY